MPGPGEPSGERRAGNSAPRRRPASSVRRVSHLCRNRPCPQGAHSPGIGGNADAGSRRALPSVCLLPTEFLLGEDEEKRRRWLSLFQGAGEASPDSLRIKGGWVHSPNLFNKYLRAYPRGRRHRWLWGPNDPWLPEADLVTALE